MNNKAGQLRDLLFKPTLNKRLAAMMLGLSMSLVIILLAMYYSTEKVFYNEFDKRTSELTKAIQIGLEDAMKSGVTDEGRLQGYLEKLNIKGVTEISIISTSDKIISSTDPDRVGKWITKSKKELIVKADLGEPLTEKGQGYDIVIPVVVGEDHLGYINLSVDNEDFSGFVRAGMIRRVTAAVIILGVGMWLSLILARRYTKPIEQVADAARMVAMGRFDHELPTDRRDEIGDLATSFKHMVERLREDTELRERLRKAEIMAGMGEVSMYLAHEIKNPLNFLSLSIDHIKEAYKPQEPVKEEAYRKLLDNMKNEVRRIGLFSESFLQYSRPLRLNLEDIDASGIIRDVIELASARAGAERIHIKLSLGAVSPIVADPAFLKTCIMNVILNAFQAMPGGGLLTVRTVTENGTLSIRVEDTGEGMDEDTLSKIFDPFYTTRPEGLGLGLALTKGIIEEHGGTLSVQSTLGKGTAVTMSLPVKGPSGKEGN